MSKTAYQVILTLILLLGCFTFIVGKRLYRQHQIESMAKDMYIEKLEKKYKWKTNRLRMYTHLVYTEIYGPDSK